MLSSENLHGFITESHRACNCLVFIIISSSSTQDLGIEGTCIIQCATYKQLKIIKYFAECTYCN